MVVSQNTLHHPPISPLAPFHKTNETATHHATRPAMVCSWRLDNPARLTVTVLFALRRDRPCRKLLAARSRLGLWAVRRALPLCKRRWGDGGRVSVAAIFSTRLGQAWL